MPNTSPIIKTEPKQPSNSYIFVEPILYMLETVEGGVKDTKITDLSKIIKKGIKAHLSKENDTTINEITKDILDYYYELVTRHDSMLERCRKAERIIISGIHKGCE